MSTLITKKLNIFILIMIISSIKLQPPMPEKGDDEPFGEGNFGGPPDKNDEWRKQYEIIIKEIINSKYKLKKYNKYCLIMEILNILFASIIILYLAIILYKYRKSKNKNIFPIIGNNNISIIEISNDERSISKQSLEIKSENKIEDNQDAPPIISSP